MEIPIFMEEKIMLRPNHIIEGYLIESHFFTAKRWEKGKECLNLEDINSPPKGFCKGQFEWIKELTTFIFLYPKEWNSIYLEYLMQMESRNIQGNANLEYFRDEEGCLRKLNEKDVFLRIRLTGQDKEALKSIIRLIECQDVFPFRDYISYCTLPPVERKAYLEEFRYRLINQLGLDAECFVVGVSFEEDYDNSEFKGSDIYYDVLNQEYVVL